MVERDYLCARGHVAGFLHITIDFVSVNASEPVLLVQDSDANHWVNPNLLCSTIEVIRNLHRSLLIYLWLELYYLTVDLMSSTVDLIGLRDSDGRQQ
jgi:hypothetical protein